ncbi:MAG: hypothetical protein QM762_14565 [Chryseolinea sp.]
MDAVLKLKHWQVFGLLILYESLLVVVLNFSKIQTPSVLDMFLFIVIPIFGYSLLLTHALDKHLELSNDKVVAGLKTYNLFWLAFVTAFLVSEGLIDGERSMEPESISTTELATRILLACVAIYFAYKFYRVPGQTLRSLELKREAGFWEYVVDAFQIFAWPLCIWWIQPRINKAFKKLQSESISTN